MRRTRVALIVDLVWLAGTVLAGAGLWLFGASGPGLAIAGLALAAAFVLSLVIARAIEREVQVKLAALGRAVGAGGGSGAPEAVSVEAIIANLAGRLERAHPFKAAFAALERPAVVVAAGGEILGATRGLGDLRPDALEGADVALLLGESYAAGGLRADELIGLGAARYMARPHMVGNGRQLIEFVPAGAYIADDDLDAFATALAGGQTGFRFEAQARAASPALRALEAGLEALDPGVAALDRLAAGEAPGAALCEGNAGIAPKVRALADFIAVLDDERRESAEARTALERKCEAVLAAIDTYRVSITTIAECAEAARTGMEAAGTAVGRGRERGEAAGRLAREARTVLDKAALAAGRADEAASGVAAAAVEIDKLVAAIEDVSFRTNLLALNAAVEAARAGEKGAGFAVVADEVRMLAQVTQKTSRDIRGLVGASRSQADAGAGEAGALRETLARLGGHLENLSTEADSIAGALTEGGGAIGRLAGAVTTLGETASQALALPARRQQKVAGGR